MGETRTEDDVDLRMVHRLVFFSDAVFAIVLTLLVLELRPPEGRTNRELLEGMRELSPHFFSFALTFVVVAIFWAAHMQITRRMVVFDWPSAWLNLAFLLAIALTPFASAMIGEHVSTGVAWQVYCATLIAGSLGQTALWLCLSRDKGRFIGGVDSRERAYRTLRGLSPAIAFGAGYASMMMGYGAFVVWSGALIPVIMGLAALLFGPRRPRPA
jgi:uncharacterized membrane protein